MLMFASFAAAVAAVSALPYNGYNGYSGYSGFSKVLPTATTFNTGVVPAGYSAGYATHGLLGGYSNLGLSRVQNVGLARGYNTGYAGGLSYGSAAVAPLAVQTSHQVQYADVPSGGSISPISVDVDANPIPINMVFRSASSLLNVEQAHQGTAGSVQESASEDEAHVLRHSVTKPVIQEVREVIQPFRKITQEVQPVSEQINTIVARGVNKAVLAAPVAQSVNTFSAPIGATYNTGYNTGYNTAYNTGFRSMAAPLSTSYNTGYTTGFAAPLATTGYTTGFSSLASPTVFSANKFSNY
jgi:hypothetical protein